MNVLVPGGAGYIGAVLCPWLLTRGHIVTVYDTFWFGPASLPEDNAHLRVIKGDVRDRDAFAEACWGQDAVIYLASISNNDLCEQRPMLAAEVNVQAMSDAPRIAKEGGVKRFIYASSVAGYPPSEEPCKETVEIGKPTLYAIGKHWGEQSTRWQCDYAIVRSASVCGPSSRQRFDTTVNMMVHDACKKGVITVHGGEQKRSHIHIYDLCDFYALLLDVGWDRIKGQIFNAVSENLSVLSTAKLVAEQTGARIDIRPRSDNRSYTVDGTKAREVLGFTPKRYVRDAIRDLKARFDSDEQGITRQYEGSLTEPRYMNMLPEGVH